ncbi:hypothetical protein Tco_1144300 [Tanacetum coccineum]
MLTNLTSVNVSSAYVIKKKTKNKSPAVFESCSDKKADSSTEKLLLTLMEGVKGLKKQIEIPSSTSSSNSQSTKKAHMIPKPFKECKYCRFNDHYSNNYEYYHGCEVYGSVAHETDDCPKKHPNRILKEVLNWFLEITLHETPKDVAQLIVMESLLPGLLMEPYSTKIMKLFSLLLEEQMSMSLIFHLTMKKAMPIDSDYTHVDLHYVEDQRKNLVNKYNLLKQELSLHRSELFNLKNTMFINYSLQNEVIRVNLENESLKEEISDLKKVIEKWTCSKVTIDQLLSEQIPDNIVKVLGGREDNLTSINMSSAYVIKKKTENKSPAVFKFCSDKKADSSTKQLLLTLMEEYVEVLLMNQLTVLRGTLTAGNQGSATSDLPNPLKSGFTKETNLCENVCVGLLKEKSGPKVVFGNDSSGDTEVYGLVNYNGITFTMVVYVNGLKSNLISISQLCDANFNVLFTKTQETIFNQNDEVVRIAPIRRDVYIIDMSS